MAKTTSQIVAENKRKRAEERETENLRRQQSAGIRREEAAASRQRPPASNSEQTDWEQAEQLVSPAFFDKMLGNETAGWDQGGLEADALVSPEFLYQMLERATSNRDQKERELREYNQNFYTPTDSTGRRLTYQEMRNGGSGWETPGSQYYLENQTLGDLVGDEGKAYVQGLQEKKRALDAARQEADQAIYGLDMYEISRMTPEEQNALAAYMWAKDNAWVNGTGGVTNDLFQKRKDVLNVLGDRYDIKRIDELAETYGRSLNAEIMREIQELGQEQGHGSVGTKIWSSALTVPANVLGDITSPLGHLKDLTTSTGRYSGFDPNSMGGVFDTYSQGVRGAVAEDIRGDGEIGWRNWAALGYQGGMGALDTVAEMALFGDYAKIVSGIGTFGDSITDASKRGASYGDALMLAAANTAIDVGAEKISMDKLADTNLLRSTLKGMGIELTKEEAKLVASKLADAAIMQDNSDFNRQIALEMQEGKTYEEAHTAASKAFLEEVLETALSSTLSGGVEGFFKGLSNRQKAQGLNAPQEEVRREAERTADGRRVEDVNRVVEEYIQTRKEQQADEIAKNLRYGDEYAQLKESLGENAPKTLEDFRDLKYSSDDWDQFQSYQRSVESGKLSAMADFDLYQKTSSDIDKSLMGVNTSNGIQITKKSDTFISYVIGSVEERRSGVDIKDIYAALTDPNTTVYPVKTSANGKASQKFKSRSVVVTVDPQTGNLIKVRPYRGK